MESIVVRGVTLKRDLAGIVLIGVPNSPGIAAKIFARISRHNIIVDDIMQNIYENGAAANLGFTTTVGDAKEAVAVCEEIASEVGIKKIEVEEGVAKVSIVGIGM
jgi:aspartate kinase